MKKTIDHLRFVLLSLIVMIVISSGVFALEVNFSQANDIEHFLDEIKTEKLMIYKDRILKNGKVQAWKYTKENLETNPVFQVYDLTSKDYDLMFGKSWHDNEDIKFSQLRKIAVTYYGYDQAYHIGYLIVNKLVVDDVLIIFRGAYEARYPIEKIRPIHYYDGDDDLSMADNNTSAFNYRQVAGQNKLSLHAYGLAIDINPVVNPFVDGDLVMPLKGENYLDRSLEQKGMIIKDDALYKLFVKQGWTWGGDWHAKKDYQHFDKWSVLEKMKTKD